jgi:hypothetical protein
MLCCLEVEFLSLSESCVAVSSICVAPFSNMCSTRANSFRKLQLRCGCQFPWCALGLMPHWFPRWSCGRLLLRGLCDQFIELSLKLKRMKFACIIILYFRILLHYCTSLMFYFTPSIMQRTTTQKLD